MTTPWMMHRKNDFYTKNFATTKYGPVYVVLARLPREWLWVIHAGPDQSGPEKETGYVKSKNQMHDFENYLAELEQQE